MDKPSKEVSVDELIPRRIRDLVRECACSRLTCYTFCGCDCHKHSLTDIEARKRERNFAAAPALLEALESFVDLLDGEPEKEKQGMAYKWDSPLEWLVDKARGWDQTKLYNELANLARLLDSDQLQDEYQADMDQDGYFEREEAEG